jgi:hypothetical protein
MIAVWIVDLLHLLLRDFYDYVILGVEGWPWP